MSIIVDQRDPNLSTKNKQALDNTYINERYNYPRAGVSLAAATEFRGSPVRKAVEILVDGISGSDIHKDFVYKAPYFIEGQTITATQNIESARFAWFLILIWLAANINNSCSSYCGFHEAEVWFNGGSCATNFHVSSQVSSESLYKAEQVLSCLIIDTELKQLLPYILEEHGPGSRASVMKDPSTIGARAAKRKLGVFYTPSDVADYMVTYVYQLYKGDYLTAKALDPACGTGVFLLSLLRQAKKQYKEGFSRLNYITTCLHGIDLTPRSLDAAAFLLLIECLDEVRIQSIKPIEAWQQIRRNLVEIDSILVFPNSYADKCNSFTLPLIKELFPKAHAGFDILVGNPPYIDLGKRVDFNLLKDRFASLIDVRASSRLKLYLLFIEMMWQLTKSGCNASALVTPLSIAYHTGAQYQNCRHAMRLNGGRWQFAFFDREPHALFGEEVKTRNAILFRAENVSTPKRNQVSEIETGPLRKWTSRIRKDLFKSISFSALGAMDIRTGIPKLGGSLQSESYLKLHQMCHRFSTFPLHIGKCALIEAFKYDSTPKVFIGGTAYNFLNVYRATKFLPEEDQNLLSKSPVHCLHFKSESEANCALAILSSRIVFWLWHVIGDGFHVTKQLFTAIPFSKESFSQKELASLSYLGKMLWQRLQDHRFVSMNRGSMTIGFRPLGCHKERDNIDSIMVKAAGLSEEFLDELQQYVQVNAVVDLTDKRRENIL